MAVNTSCRGPDGFHGLHNVNDPNSRKDPQESFFLAETMKYFYLLFTDDIISLDEWVFNTEAHPLPVWSEEGASKWIPLFAEFDREGLSQYFTNTTTAK